MYKGITIIAEVKPISPMDKRPSDFELAIKWYDLLRAAMTTKETDMVSVHTGKDWGGFFGQVGVAQRIMNVNCCWDIPILAKGLHYNDSQTDAGIKAGARYSLAVGFIPKNLDNCIIEPWDFNQLREFSKALPPHAKLLWNSRDLRAMVERREKANKPETFADARSVWKHWLAQASNISTEADIDYKSDPQAVLVGTNMPKFVASLR